MAKTKVSQKVAVCHYDDATGGFTLLEVPERAAEAHMRHGDLPLANLDMLNDPLHCGGCGIACGANAVCENGTCVAVRPGVRTITGDLVEGGPVMWGENCPVTFNGAPYTTHVIEHPGGAISLELKGEFSDGGALFDPVLLVYAGATLPPGDLWMARMAYDDDCGYATDAYIALADLAAGAYTVLVTGYVGEPYGSYTLELYGFSGGEPSQFCPPYQ